MDTLFDQEVDERRVSILRDAMRDPKFRDDLNKDLQRNKEESEERDKEFTPSPQRMLMRMTQ